MIRRFDHFVCIDWSGQAIERPKGIALACAIGPDAAPVLLHRTGGWSREAVLDWLIAQAANGTDVLVGVDFSASFPFEDQGAFLPGFPASPPDARSLWRLVAETCADEAHLAANAFCAHSEISRHFRRQSRRETLTGDLFPAGAGRLRRTERTLLESKAGHPASCFNLVGAKQVGKSSLTGMRLLDRLAGRVPIWPFDPVPKDGPLLIEIYTGLAAIAAGVPRNRTKIRDGETLDAALARLGSRPHAPLARYDDHSTDAILTAAWLRAVDGRPALWSPPGLTPALATTEGWTFGVA